MFHEDMEAEPEGGLRAKPGSVSAGPSVASGRSQASGSGSGSGAARGGADPKGSASPAGSGGAGAGETGRSSASGAGGAAAGGSAAGGSQAGSDSVPASEHGGVGAEAKDALTEEEIAALEKEVGGEPGQRHAMRKSTSCPGPGDYMWDDNIHLRKKPVWSMTSPDRKNLDLLIGTWTPASMSLQPRAPDPGEYGTMEGIGRNGKFSQPQWSYGRASGRPCLAPPPPDKLETALKVYSSLGGDHPGYANRAHWSISGVERKNLGMGTTSWTPSASTEYRPGPGAYDVHRKPKWKASSRKGTFGGRQGNLHPECQAWVPQTHGSRLLGGEAARLGLSAPKLRPMFLPSMLKTHH